MLDSMQENVIGHIVDVCASVGHFDRVYDLVEKYPLFMAQWVFIRMMRIRWMQQFWMRSADIAT